MRFSLEQAIRDHLAAYLADAASLDDFKDWLVGATWDVEQSHQPAAIDLTYDIKLLLAEHSGGYLSENELRASLRPLGGPGAELSRVVAATKRS